MITVGIDLASQATKTGLAIVEWSGAGAVVLRVSPSATDAEILEAIRESVKAGIDCPFGWSDEFVDYVSEHRRGDVAQRLPSLDNWRQPLAYRTTDLAVRDFMRSFPLSASADKFGYVAMRCAALLATLSDAVPAVDVDRSGAGCVVEVYPAASLKAWKLDWRKYKRQENLAALSALVTDLEERTENWLDLSDHAASCRSSDDAFDAVIAALTARASDRGLVEPVPEEHLDRARTEGWIAVPTEGSLDLLVGGE